MKNPNGVCKGYSNYCFDCWHKKECIYKREKDIENIFEKFFGGNNE